MAYLSFPPRAWLLAA